MEAANRIHQPLQAEAAQQRPVQPTAAQPPHLERHNPYDPSRMDFTTPEERQLACKIRAAIQKSPDIDNLPDFYYAQLSLATKANFEDRGRDGDGNDQGNQDDEGGVVQAALNTAHHLQEFREQYGILDTFEDAQRSLRNFLSLIGPRVYLSFCFNSRDGNYCIIYDIAAIDQKTLKGPNSPEIYQKGVYYMLHALACDLEAIRRGAILICECEGFDWKKHMDFSTTKKIMTELTCAYPVTFQRFKYFHAGIFINLMNSLKKRFLPKRIIDKMDTACQFDGRLSDIYLVPNPEAASQKVYLRLVEALLQRYANIETFRLPTDRKEMGASL